MAVILDIIAVNVNIINFDSFERGRMDLPAKAGYICQNENYYYDDKECDNAKKIW